MSTYTLARLKADPRTAPLSEGLEKARDAVLAAASARRSTKDAALLAMAARDARDYELDRLISRVSLTTLAALSNRRDAPEYKRLFPAGANALTTLPWADEVSAVNLLLGRMAESPADAPARALTDQLKAANDALAAALTGHSTALQADAAARGKEIEVRDAWRRVYRKLYAELLAAFPDEKGWVETFFRTPANDTHATDAPQPTSPA